MARLIGLDVGGVRTGVASTDDLKLICSPLDTVKTSELMAKLRALTDTHEVEGFVVGKPNLIAGAAGVPSIFSFPPGATSGRRAARPCLAC